MSVLVIEDYDTARKAFCLMVESYGVTACRGGSLAGGARGSSTSHHVRASSETARWSC